jgi:chemotaxis receptor (MCP) glutamine deamidase CheD
MPSAPRRSGLEVVTINVGEMHASTNEVEIKTLLGSCVAACLYDPTTGIGGMNHFLLPDSVDAGSDPARFGVHAMEMLINALMKLGADRRRLEGKLFGGGNVLGSVVARPTVGERNSAFAREYLAKERIPLVSERLGSDCGTEVRFWAHTGRVFIRDISTSLLDLSRERKPAAPVVKGGEVELF